MFPINVECSVGLEEAFIMKWPSLHQTPRCGCEGPRPAPQGRVGSWEPVRGPGPRSDGPAGLMSKRLTHSHLRQAPLFFGFSWLKIIDLLYADDSNAIHRAEVPPLSTSMTIILDHGCNGLFFVLFQTLHHSGASLCI